MTIRVSHFAHADAGSGASANALRLHRGLAELGVRSRLLVAQKLSDVPDVVQLRQASFVGRRWRELEPWLEARVLDRLAPGREQPLSSGLLGYDPVPCVEADGSDLVQLHWLGCASLRLDRLPALSRPIVWRLADMWAFCGVEHLCEDPRPFLVDASGPDQSAPAIDRWLERRKRRIYGRMKNLTVVCPSHWLAELAGRSRLLQGRPIEVIPTGCDTTLFRPLDRRTCRDLLGLPQDRPLVLAGATNLAAHHKGLDLFVTAINGLQGAQRDATAVLFGPRASDVTRALALPVIDQGFISDPLRMALLYSACDVFVAPSRIENLSNAVPEAMACGTPCVAFPIGGMPDMIAHREAGYLARPFEAEDLATGIGWALENGTDHALRDRCRAVIEARFSQAAQAEAFLALYRRILDARPDRGP